MTTYYHARRVSDNKKTGPIPVTTSSRNTCPDACPLKAGGCYAKSGPLALHWTAVSNGERAGDLSAPTLEGLVAFVRSLPRGQLWRMSQAGDLPGDGASNRIDVDALARIVAANRGRRGFTYTHYPVTDNPQDDNAAAIRHANEHGFAINLSADNPAQADRLSDMGIAPVVTLLSDTATDKAYKTPAGRTIVTCPAAIREGVTCATCGICADSGRSFIVGFPAHGTSKKKATRIAMQEATA